MRRPIAVGIAPRDVDVEVILHLFDESHPFTRELSSRTCQGPQMSADEISAGIG